MFIPVIRSPGYLELITCSDYNIVLLVKVFNETPTVALLHEKELVGAVYLPHGPCEFICPYILAHEAEG